MKGKLIVIESGTDSSGKATQTKRLAGRLTDDGVQMLKVEYPNYESESSTLVKMYLRGEFGQNAEDVNAYASSTFFAVDRYASYKKEWEEDYLSGKLVIADRYTTSNMVHQASKMDETSEKDEYLDWLYDLEFQKMGLPKPDLVIFLNMDPKFSLELMKERANKIDGSQEKDIHEKDSQYLQKTYQNSLYIAEKYGWKMVECSRDGKLRSIEDINDEIYSLVKDIL